MAGVFSTSEIKSLDIHTTCCLGDHPLQIPKLLPCQHSSCTECLKTKVGQDRTVLICPKCHLSIPLTRKEVERLPDDFLFPILKRTKDNNSDCDMCKFEDKTTPGTFQCLDCGEVTCDQCRDGHTKSLYTRSHRLVAVKEVQSGKYRSEIEATRKGLCETHSKPKTTMFLDYFCEECKCLACEICVLKQHQPQGHKCQTIDKIHEKNTKAVTDHVTKLLDLKERDEELISALKQSQGQNKELQEKLENEVYERATVIIDIVEKVKQDKLTQILDHFEKEDISTQSKLEETKNRMIRTDSIVSYTQTFLEHSDKAEFLQHEHEIIRHLKENNQQQYDRRVKSNILGIGELQIEQIEVIISKAFGDVEIETEELGITKEVNAYRQWMEIPEVLFSKDSGMEYNPWDLTVTENEDIVAVQGSTIQVYNSEGKQKERINCSQLKNAWNVVAKGSRLYVSDQDTNGNVLVLDFKGNVQKTITIPEISQGCYNSLAVDKESNVYISSCKTDTIYKCKRNETNAEVFIQQGTHPDLKKPWYICTTPSLELVVSNDYFNSRYLQVYDRNGKFLWQYKGQGNIGLDRTWGVCCDREGYIYIAECNRIRVQVIRNGEFQKCIKFQSGCGIAIDKEDNLVCCYNKKITKLKIWQ